MIKPLNSLLSLPLIILLSAAVVAMSFTPISYSLNATNTDPNVIKGSITSTTNNGTSTDPAWIVGGTFKFTNVNSDSPVFNSTFYMVKIDGTAKHTHSIYDFKLTGKPTSENVGNVTSTTYNGVSTVTMKEGPVTDVPTQIKVMGDSAVSISLDGSKINNHFGTKPIFGTQHLICIEKPELCK